MRIQRNPVLTWCAAGAVLEEDAAGNRKFTKKKATGRIDGIVALTMARGAGRKPFTEQTQQIQQGFVVLSS
jgi:phage terminase large subunit-like protein